MRNATDFEMWSLVVVVVMTLATAICLIIFPEYVNRSLFADANQISRLLPPIALSAGVLLAILAFARENNKNELEGDDTAQEYFLNAPHLVSRVWWTY